MKKTIYSILCVLAAYTNIKGQCSPTWPTSVTATAYTICPGQSVTLTPNSMGSLGGAGWFQWYTSGPAGSFAFGPQTSFCGSITTATLAAGTHNFFYHAGGGGCGSPVFPVVGQVSIYVVTPTLNVSNGSMCSGNSYTISPTGATSYTYATNGYPNTFGSSAVVAPPVPALPSGVRIYTVTGSVGPGCAQTKTMSLTITQTPTISVAPSATICSGNQFLLNATGATSYTVNTGVNTSTLSGPYNFGLGIYNPTVTTNYTVTASTNDCTATNTVFTDVTVNSSPTIAISNTTICAGTSYTLNPTGATSYTYSSGSAVVSPTTTTTYVITGSNGSCSSTKNVTVTTNPLPTTFLNPLSDIACAQSIYQLNTFNANPSFSTTINGIPSTLASNYNYTVSGTQSHTYSIVVTNTVTGCSKALPVFTLTVPSATLVVTTSNATLCPGQSAALTLTTSAGGTAIHSISWYPGPFGANSYSVSVSPSVTTTYTVSAQDQTGYGCNFSATYTQSVAPAISLSVNTSTTNLCTGQSSTLTTSATNANSYSWSTGSSAASIVVSPTVTSTYSVTASNALGCSKTQTITQVVSACTSTTTGIENINSGKAWNLYPNPANEFIVIELSDSFITGAPVEIELLNMLGEVVYKESASQNVIRLNTDTLENGIYIVQLTQGNMSSAKKIIKQR